MSNQHKHSKHKGLGKYVQLSQEILSSGKKPPIFIYQMGKVGSSSVRDTLLNLEVGNVFHLHSFLPWRNLTTEELKLEGEMKEYVDREIKHSKASFKKYSRSTRIKALIHEGLYLKPLYNRVVKGTKPSKFIVSVREPVSVNMSMFFERFEQYAGKPYEKCNLSTDEILNIFLTKYIFSWPITWFDKEFKPVLGIDIYERPLPAEGYDNFKNGNVEVLLFKAEISNSLKEKILSDFLKLENFKLLPSNIGESKMYADQYREFKQRIRLPENVLRELLDSKYCKHFYSEEERNAIYAKWIKK